MSGASMGVGVEVEGVGGMEVEVGVEGSVVEGSLALSSRIIHS